MKKLIIILFCLPIIGFGQNSVHNLSNPSAPMQQLKNVKELYEMGLISKIEYDSISIELKNRILNDINKLEDGFYYNNKIMYPEKFYTTQKGTLLSNAINSVIPLATKSKIEGLTSPNKIDGAQQVFKLILSPSQDLSGNPTTDISYQQSISIAKSPKDFILTKLSIDRDKGFRWISTQQYSYIFGGDNTIDIKEFITFNWKENNNNEFEINTQLGDGEYTFVFLGSKHGETNRLFTFSVENSPIRDISKDIKKPIRSSFSSTAKYQKALKEWNEKNRMNYE
jgi:hypothetical protein